MLSGTDPADYPRAPVEIVLVSLTLVAQLGLALNRGSGGEGEAGGGEGCSEVDEGCEHDAKDEDEEEEEVGRRGRGGRRRRRRRWRRDAVRAARLRRFLGEQASAGEINLCVGHAACRAESKDLARRVASLISLLQARTAPPVRGVCYSY